MKLLSISIFLVTTTVFADGIVKKDADLDAILNKIDAISQAVKQKELEEKNFVPVQEVQPQTINKDEELEQELMREERELSLKERKLELSQKKQNYYKKYKQIQDKSRSFLIKKTNKLIKSLKKELSNLEKKATYSINIDKFMKIGQKKYAYIPSTKLNSIKKETLSIEGKIKNIKNTIKKLQNSYDLDSDTWFQTINTIENQLQDSPKELVNVVAAQPSTNFTQSNYIKVQEGDTFDNVIVKKVDEQKVILALKEK